MQVLPYEIPPFKTIAWISDEAKAIWIPRFEKINKALINVSIEAIKNGKLHQQYLIVEGWLYFELLEMAEESDISIKARFLGDENVRGPIYYEVLITSPDLEQEEKTSNCCLECSEYVANSQRKEHIWEAAKLSEHSTIKDLQITLPSEVDTSVFWQRFLVTVGNQHRCRLDCEEHKQKQLKSFELLKTMRYEEEYNWLTQIYSWPIAWNATHGICELRTPIVKLAYDTDATANTHIVHIEGSTYPSEGAPGNRFPYRQRKFLRITDSKSFKAGLEHGC